MIDLNEALHEEPWGNYDLPLRVFRDKIVTFRKVHKCHSCQQEIKAGTRGRSRTEKSSEFDDLEAFRWCTVCTAAQAIAQNDEGDVMERRHIIAAGVTPGVSGAESAWTPAWFWAWFDRHFKEVENDRDEDAAEGEDTEFLDDTIGLYMKFTKLRDHEAAQ